MNVKKHVSKSCIWYGYMLKQKCHPLSYPYFHRIDGPAFFGKKIEYYLNDKQFHPWWKQKR